MSTSKAVSLPCDSTEASSIPAQIGVRCTKDELPCQAGVPGGEALRRSSLVAGGWWALLGKSSKMGRVATQYARWT